MKGESRAKLGGKEKESKIQMQNRKENINESIL